MGMEDTDLTRRDVMTAGIGAGLVAAAGLTVGATPSAAKTGHAALEQIAQMMGGWEFDQDEAMKMLANVKSEADLMSAPRKAQVFVGRSHGVQCAMIAEDEGADSPQIVAALLHDLGHNLAPPAPRSLEENYDDKHEIYGSLWLRNIFVDEVADAILNHVPAKRYLVTTRTAYYDILSQGSKDSLMKQGGFMTDEEVAAYEDTHGWQEGVQIRLWDDRGKVWDTKLRQVSSFARHMEATLRS